MAKETDNGRKAVVTDLGLASRLNATSGRTFASRHARLYRPPEVWQGFGYGPRSDIYQLGIVLYQLLGGRIDFSLNGLPDAELKEAIVAGNILDWDHLPAHIGPSLRALLGRATDTNESARFDSMADFCVALNNVRTKQYDWRYEVDGTSFSIERNENGKQLRLEVRKVAKNTISVQRFKRATGSFKKSKSAVIITHSNPCRSQGLQRIIRETW